MVFEYEKPAKSFFDKGEDIQKDKIYLRRFFHVMREVFNICKIHRKQILNVLLNYNHVLINY